MSILRENPFTNEWTLYAKTRGNRPHDFAKNMSVVPEREKACPFCKANDVITSDIVYWDKKDWNVCVIPNLYPIITDETEEIEEEPFYKTIEGMGHHEVLVDTADHEKTIDEFNNEEMLMLFESFDNRYNFLRKKAGTKYVQIFKNNGPSEV